ncbi:rhomboid family intramembrane serine protease [Haladaptatus caseinilyticus]|uniref:rhomboid family intramembrane serine protease n=1 Tax=Haladaptatus caseinilyticus TaxID=2993314 RepID=UPI00224B6210|nr:rhomboid family intramembrane serine protease [Haladaptatus caseinilyticus]
MAQCDECGEHENMPYQCRMCGNTFCADHRLPENHSCPGLNQWNDPKGVFDSGFDDSVNGQSRGRSFGVNTGTGGPLAYFRGNMTFVFLGLMWLTFLFQYAIVPILFGIPSGSAEWLNIFTLNTAHPFYVWTWFTSVFAHGSFGHIAINSLVLYFFGPVVERRIGSEKFTILFLITGAVSGLAQVWATILTEPGVFVPVLGASGAIAAIMGVLTVLNPNLRIYLYFIIPMPLWLATLGFAVYSAFTSVLGGIGAGGVAQLAHLTGLGLGLLYGAKLKKEGERAPKQLEFGGGGRGGMGGRRF